MSYLLFLDDERYPPADQPWVVARSVRHAKDVVQRNGWPSHVSLDGHLGTPDSGLDFARWLCERHAEDPAPASFEYSIHTADDFMSAQIENMMHEAFGKGSLNHQPEWWRNERDLFQ